MLRIKGVIGEDIIGNNFSEQISRLSGNVDIEINSPGGCVSDGITIFNAIKRYEKGKVNIQVTGECSSMAAYIMLAGDTLAFEPNSIVILHNPWGVAVGDYRALTHKAQILEKMADLYASEFVKKGIFNEKEIKAAMDEERWFIGKEDLKILGDVIERENIAVPSEEQKALIVKNAKNNILAWQKRTFARVEAKEDNREISKIAALILPKSEKIEQSQKQESLNTDKTIQKERENKMDLKEFKNNHADLYAQVTNESLKIGEKTGQEKEQKRINGLLAFIDDDKDTVVKAIKEGKSIHDDDIFACLTRARINKNTIKAMQEESPEGIKAKSPEELEKEKEKKTQEEKEQAQKKTT